MAEEERQQELDQMIHENLEKMEVRVAIPSPPQALGHAALQRAGPDG